MTTYAASAAAVDAPDAVAIERVRSYQVTMPLRHSFETSSHRKRHLTHILIELTDSDGRTGWGEIASPSDPFYASENVETAWHLVTAYLSDIALAAARAHPAALETAWSRIRGHEFAKAGFSIAAWDLFARRAGQPLAAMLGGERPEVAAGVSLGIEPSIEALLEQVDAQVEAGYRRVKLKIAPGWDLAPVAAVRGAYPDLDLHVDANAAYPATDDSIELLRRLDRYRLTMIEQPHGVRDFAGHARLQRAIETPVCLDESIVTVEDLHTMLAMDAGRVLNIKVSRMGGLTSARAAHDAAVDAGVPVWCGGMHEFGVGRAANVALASLPGFSLPSDVSGSDKYYEEDLIEPPVVANAGMVRVPTVPGLGHAVLAERIRRLASRGFEATAAGSRTSQPADTSTAERNDA